jgi:hypothetical protein
MRVNIEPYSRDLIPVRRWENSYNEWRHETIYREEKEYDLLDKIVCGFLDALQDLVRPLNRWSNKRKRKIKVRIDSYDVWSADHTLAIIIVPVLKKLKEQQQGCPIVDNEDVPEELRVIDNKRELYDWDDTLNSKNEVRWNYVLNEMIWAFEQHAHDDDEAKFHHNTSQLSIEFASLEDNPKSSSMKINRQKDPNRPEYWVDDKGIEEHRARKQNGIRLFAKYYNALWD